MKTNKIKHISFILLSIIFWIAVWDFASYRKDSSLVLPSPAETLKTLGVLIKNKDFIIICQTSVVRIFLGASIGILIGSVLAVGGHFLKLIKYLTSPIMAVVKATPVASFIVLLLIVIGKAPVPAVTSALITVPIIYSNLSRSIEGINKELSEVCRVYNLSFKKRLTALWIPSLKPGFISGIKSCIGLSWKAGIAAEVLCAPKDSIGLKIHETKIYLETPSLFAWTTVVVLLSLIFEWIALSLLKERRRK